MPPDVAGQVVCRLVAACPFLLQRFEHNPIEITTQAAGIRCNGGAMAERNRTDPSARFDGCLLADHASHFIVGYATHFFTFQRCRSGKQLVENHAQGIDIATGIDVLDIRFCLFRAHVLGSPNHATELSKGRLAG